MVAYATTQAKRTVLLPRSAPIAAHGFGSVRAPRGLSLVELMVALVLGLFLVGGIIQVLSSSRTSYGLAEATGRAQEGGRYALNALARAMRPSASTACRDVYLDAGNLKGIVKSCILLANPADCTGDPVIGAATPLGFSASQMPSPTGLPAAVGSRWLRGDVLVSWGVTGEGLYAQKGTTSGTTEGGKAAINLIGAVGKDALAAADFRGGHLAMITDCATSDIFTISDAASDDPLASLNHAVTVNTDASLLTLSKAPDPNPRARVFPFDLSVYFICCTDETTGILQTGAGVSNCNDAAKQDQYRPGLCRWSASSLDTQVLATNVADLRATYYRRFDATDTDTAAGTTASAVANWEQIFSARVQLLVTGGDAVKRSAAAPIATNPTGLGSGMVSDRRLYETFETTIAIRSRLPN